MDRLGAALVLLRELAKAEPVECPSDIHAFYDGVCLFCTPEVACVFEGKQITEESGYTYAPDARYEWIHTGDCLVLKARAYLDAVKGTEI